MPSKVTSTAAWAEIHLRTDNLLKPASVAEVRPEDYYLAGGRVPMKELQCLSDLYGMFREVPKGFESLMPRAIGFYDVLTLVRLLSTGQRMTYPMILLPEKELKAFNADGVATTTQPKRDHTSYPPVYVAGVWLVALRLPWPSHTP